VGIPVLLSALTNIGAGLTLLGAETQPFFEIGMFMVLLAAWSYTITVFVFPSILLLLVNKKP